jgi:hypothetical protein
MPTNKDWLQKHELRIKAHDRQLKATRELIHEGIRLMVETRRTLRDLAASQKKTDASLKAFIDSLRRSGGNGHTKAKVDLQ